MKSHESKQTTDHDTIKKWVEARQGRPAMVEATDQGKDGGVLRIKFQDHTKETLEEISWDQFFRIFDENNLQFLYQENTREGNEIRFFKFTKK